MCWPPGTAERRYAGVTHLDVTDLTPDAIKRVHDLIGPTRRGDLGTGLLSESARRPIGPSRTWRSPTCTEVIDAAAELGVGVVNSFVGRDPALSVDANWPRFLEVWRPLVDHAEEQGVRIGIENCPMLFTADEWPGGKNLATSPAIWRRMFAEIPSPSFGLNLRPVAPDLAADGLPRPARASSATGWSTSTPRTPGSTARRSTTTASWPTPSSGTRPSSPAWATSAGAPSSARSPTSATTGPSPSRSRTAPSKARSRADANPWSSAADTCSSSSVG